MEASTFVIAVGVPPESEILWMPVCESGAKMITPSRFQLPPRPNGASQSVLAVPPSRLIFFSFPSAKKPSERPSGDQKGKVAPSVPAIGSAASFPRGRTQISATPFILTATKASSVPSALNANEPPLSPIRLSVVPSGGRMKDLLEGEDGFFF